MQKFEVYIPAKETGGKSTVFHIDADNWITALKSGLAAVGEQGDIMSRLMCDIRPDNNIHVTDSKTGRVFKLRDISNLAPGEGIVPSQETSLSGTTAPAAEEEMIGRQLSGEEFEDIMMDLFAKAQEVYQFSKDESKGLQFMLNLTMEKINAESGSIFLADINDKYLKFGAAKGPKAKEVMKFTVPMGKGIVGFCAKEGVALTISDVKLDPRFFAEISQKIGYDTKSILCCPIQVSGRVLGALELINKVGSNVFTEQEINIAEYLSHQTAEYLLTLR